MSAALLLPEMWASSCPQNGTSISAAGPTLTLVSKANGKPAEPEPDKQPVVSMAFYRRHTQDLLRRYLYASMVVGRSPSILGGLVTRGMVSSRPVKTFEDAVIFVLDIERCLDKLKMLDRMLLSRVVLQEYSQFETAALLGMSPRTVNIRFAMALDHLTEILLQADLLTIPKS